MRHILISALVTGAAYAAFLGHRSDYLGHYLAGFGGTLFLLAFPLFFWKRPLKWVVPVLLLLAIVLGASAEATLFRIAIFDPVDFCNQSIGACLAAACLVGRPGSIRLALGNAGIGAALLFLGFVFAFA